MCLRKTAVTIPATRDSDVFVAVAGSSSIIAGYGFGLAAGSAARKHLPFYETSMYNKTVEGRGWDPDDYYAEADLDAPETPSGFFDAPEGADEVIKIQDESYQ